MDQSFFESCFPVILCLGVNMVLSAPLSREPLVVEVGVDVLYLVIVVGMVLACKVFGANLRFCCTFLNEVHLSDQFGDNDSLV
jgi:hypothetical protein